VLGVHYIFFADDLGMASIFPALKKRLAARGHKHVSLIYCSVSSRHQFRKELAILQKHFPAQLYISYHSEILTGHWIFQQEDIEAVLNANTMQQTEFIISGNAVFVEKVKAVLTFLGIKDIQIQEQYFSE